MSHRRENKLEKSLFFIVNEKSTPEKELEDQILSELAEQFADLFLLEIQSQLDSNKGRTALNKNEGKLTENDENY